MSNRRENVVFEGQQTRTRTSRYGQNCSGTSTSCSPCPCATAYLNNDLDVAVGRARPETTGRRGIDRLIRGGSNATDARDEHLLESARERMAKHHQIEHGDDRMRVQTTPLPRLGEIFENDICWPKPVWGASEPVKYSEEEARKTCEKIEGLIRECMEK